MQHRLIGKTCLICKTLSKTLAEINKGSKNFDYYYNYRRRLSITKNLFLHIFLQNIKLCIEEIKI